MQKKLFYVYDIESQAVQEAYAMLTANLYVGNPEKGFKTFVLTSCNPKEGKTSIAISLAISMAQAGWKVLLVDADMRKPTGAKRMNQGAFFGLSDYLLGNVDLSDALCETNVNNFTYLSCGNGHPNPMSLLCSNHFVMLLSNLKCEYDIILFDTPALTSVIDGALVASKADGTLLVVKSGSTTLTCLKRVKEQIEGLNANILGVILNRVKKRDYRSYFQSYNYFFNSERFLNNPKVINTYPPAGSQTYKGNF